MFAESSSLSLTNLWKMCFDSFIFRKAKLNVKARLATGWRDPYAHLVQAVPALFYRVSMPRKSHEAVPFPGGTERLGASILLST